jgi:hypothetical protein
MKRLQDLSSIVARKRLLAVLAAFILAFSGFAHAGGVSAQHEHQRKKGNLKITVPTDIGGVILQPGDYEVKEVNQQSGAVVEFARWIENPYAEGGRPLHDREVVAQVKCTLQSLSSIARETRLLFASDNIKAVGLEIRGNGTEYLF